MRPLSINRLASFLTAGGLNLFILTLFALASSTAIASEPNGGVTAIEAPRPAAMRFTDTIETVVTAADLDAFIERVFANFTVHGPVALVDMLDPQHSDLRFGVAMSLLPKFDQPQPELQQPYEFLSKDTLGSTLARYHYLVHSPRLTFWTFTFTRSNDSSAWKLYSYAATDRPNERRDFYQAVSEGDLTDAEVPLQLGRDFAANLADQEFSALKTLFSAAVRYRDKPDDLRNTVRQFQELRIIAGPSESIERVRLQNLSPSLIRMVFLEHFAQANGAWELFFYKTPKGEWTLYHLNFEFGNDRVHEILFPQSSANPHSPPPSAKLPKDR